MTTLNPDLSKPTCRVCLQNYRNEEMCSIFDMDMDFCDIHIYEKIEKCAGIKVLRHEKMPSLICGDCYGILKVSYKFRIICRNSNEYLKEFVTIEYAGESFERSLEENPLAISENSLQKEDSGSRYKTKIGDRISPLNQSMKREHVTSPHSPVKSEDFIVANSDVGDGNEVWCDIEYQNDEDNMTCDQNIEASIEQEIDIKKEMEDIKNKMVDACKTNRNKRNKISNEKAKKHNRPPSKTLEISPDGAAIIREKKPRARREQKEKQPHICEVCGNIYQRRYALELHSRRHRAEKPYECEICGYAFHSNFELIRHMRKHTGSRPYNCSYCSRAFGDQSTLIKHERIHRNERPFKCDTCGKSFSYSNVLKHHKLTHTGEKPYTCDLCGKSFTRPHHLRAHLETLQHQNDPRSKILLQNIRKTNEVETLKSDGFTILI